MSSVTGVNSGGDDDGGGAVVVVEGRERLYNLIESLPIIGTSIPVNDDRDVIGGYGENLAFE